MLSSIYIYNSLPRSLFQWLNVAIDAPFLFFYKAQLIHKEFAQFDLSENIELRHNFQSPFGVQNTNYQVKVLQPVKQQRLSVFLLSAMCIFVIFSPFSVMIPRASVLPSVQFLRNGTEADSPREVRKKSFYLDVLPSSLSFLFILSSSAASLLIIFFF